MSDLTLLPPDVPSDWERAESLVSARRRPLPADLVKSVWNPATCPADLLDHLANTLSVDVWDQSWDEEKKRRVIRRAIPVQKIKGTLAALREYAGYRDAEIVHVDRPPQRFFAGASETPAQREAWLAALPQIRLYTEGSKISAQPRVICGGGKPFFLPRRFFLPTSAPARAGERAVLWRNGVETPIGTGTWNGNGELTISTPGRRQTRMFAGLTVGAFPSPSVAADHLYRIVIDPSADLTPIAPGARLQTTRVETRSDVAFAGRRWWCGATAYRRFLCPSRAASRVYKLIPIIDGSAPPQPRKSVSFFSVTRFGVPARTADLGVDIPGRGSRLAFVPGVRRFGMFTLPSRAAERIKPAFAALAAAKRLTDTIFVNTNMHRPLTAGSSLFAGTTYRAGQWTRS